MRTTLIIVLCFTALGASYGQNKVGTTAAPFLGIGAGPRAMGMGGAFVAVASDASALYWNPAGISRTGRTEVMFEHTNYLVGTSFSFFSAVLALDADDAVGLSVTNLNYGSDIVTSINLPEGTGETWSADDWAIGLSYSRNLTDRFSIAATGKVVMQKIWRESASGYALDAGLLYITPFNNLKIAMAIANFGTDIQLSGSDLLVTYDPNPSISGNNKKIPAEYHTDAYPMPLFFRVGVAMDVINSESNRLTLATDAIHPSDNVETVNVGGEYCFENFLYLRAGMQSLGMYGRVSGFNAGVGVGYDFTMRTSVKLDFTYQSFGILDNIQRFALSVVF